MTDPRKPITEETPEAPPAAPVQRVLTEDLPEDENPGPQPLCG